MLTIQKRGTGVLLTWCFIMVAAVYVIYVAGRHFLTVDGGYSEWSDFTTCSAKCGGGAKTRTRSCTNPIPNYFGQNCSRFGVSIETLECNTQPCPIDGVFGVWGEFGPCSVTCGDGTQTRERKCDNPAPQHGGAQCQGGTKESKICQEKPCPVNGGYSDWNAWSACSVSCGSGERTRSRECNKPQPQHGGKKCEEQGFGLSKGNEQCSEKPCPTANTTASAVGDDTVNNS